VRLLDLADPLAVWLYAERYLGVGTRGYSPYAADACVSERYHPQRGAGVVPIPTVWVPDGRGAFLGNGLRSSLHALYRRPGGFLLPVHPDTLASPDLPGLDDLRACEPGPPLQVSPTANTRTVLVRQIGDAAVEPHFVKLHFPQRLSRFTRRLRRPIIEVQLWVADELARIGVPFLPEVGGGVFGADPDEAWGFLLRECAPRGAAGPPFTVPLFALYGGDYHRPDEPSLLEQLIVASGEAPADFVAQRIIEPMVRLWFAMALGAGCCAEMHGQNTLFQFVPDGTHTRIVYRDCGIYIDPVVRAQRHLTRRLPRVNVISVDIAVPRRQVWSLVYDSFLGHHVMTRMATLLSERFGVAVDTLQCAARRCFASHAGQASLLPETVHYYDNAVLDAGNWRLIDTGQPPLWR
jgi:hypothetical protein